MATSQVLNSESVDVVFSAKGRIVALKAGQFLDSGLTLGVYSGGLRGVSISGSGSIYVTIPSFFWTISSRKGQPSDLGPKITVELVKQHAEDYLKLSLSEDTVIKGIAYFLNKLSDLAYVYEVATGVVEDSNSWYYLPRSLTYLEEVRDSQNRIYTDFRVLDGLISFSDPDTYTIVYRRMPRPPTALLEEIEVHPTYFSALVNGIIGWAKLQDDDLSPDGLRRVSEFREEALKSFNILRRGRKTVQTVRVIR